MAIILGGAQGAVAQAATDIPGATALPAGTIFTGTISIAIGIGQAVGAAAAGTSRLVISWVPGAGGTSAGTVAEIDLVVGLGGAATESQAAESLAVPIVLYAGTTAGGKFQAAVIESGTISNRQWSVTINGQAI